MKLYMVSNGDYDDSDFKVGFELYSSKDKAYDRYVELCRDRMNWLAATFHGENKESEKTELINVFNDHMQKMQEKWYQYDKVIDFNEEGLYVDSHCLGDNNVVLEELTFSPFGIYNPWDEIDLAIISIE